MVNSSLQKSGKAQSAVVRTLIISSKLHCIQDSNIPFIKNNHQEVEW